MLVLLTKNRIAAFALRNVGQPDHFFIMVDPGRHFAAQLHKFLQERKQPDGALADHGLKIGLFNVILHLFKYLPDNGHKPL